MNCSLSEGCLQPWIILTAGNKAVRAELLCSGCRPVGLQKGKGREKLQFLRHLTTSGLVDTAYRMERKLSDCAKL